MAGILDFIVGKKDEGKAPDPIAGDILATQRRAGNFQEKILDDYRKKYIDGPSVEKEAEENARLDLDSIGGQEGDATRLLSSNLAMRGLGPNSRSSIGEGLRAGQQYEFDQRRDAVRASIPERIRTLRESRTGTAVNLGSGVLSSQNAPIDFYGRKPERSGGILPLIGVGVGGMLGGAAGAGAGLGAAQYLQGYQNYRYR